jgi:hypothetical protein
MESERKWQIQWRCTGLTSCILANITDHTTAAPFSSPTWTSGVCLRRRSATGESDVRHRWHRARVHLIALRNSCDAWSLEYLQSRPLNRPLNGVGSSVWRTCFVCAAFRSCRSPATSFKCRPKHQNILFLFFCIFISIKK